MFQLASKRKVALENSGEISDEALMTQLHLIWLRKLKRPITKIAKDVNDLAQTDSLDHARQASQIKALGKQVSKRKSVRTESRPGGLDRSLPWR